MRKPIIAGAIILFSLIVFAALNVNSLVERYKDYLLDRLARSVGQPVRAASVDVSFTPFAIGAKNFAVGADPANPIVSAKSIRIEPRILPLLVGRLRAARISLDTPVIVILREASGRYNFETPPSDTKPAQTGARRAEQAASEHQDIVFPPVQISHGTLRYRDLNANQELTVTEIAMTVSDYDVDEPVEIQLSAAVMAAKTNLKLQSRIGPIAGIRDYRDYPIDGRLNAERLDLGKVNQALPQLRKALPKHLRFDGIYDIKDLQLKGTLNKPSIKGAVSGTDASFRFE